MQYYGGGWIDTQVREVNQLAKKKMSVIGHFFLKRSMDYNDSA